MILLKEIQSNIGKKFNRLTLIKLVKVQQYRHFCEFSCECGRIKIIKYTNVRDGNTKSCGCIAKENLRKNAQKRYIKQIKNNIGRVIGRWTILSYDRNNKKRGQYFCKCRCGTIRSVFIARLNNHTSLSCGCLSREITSKLMFRHGLTKKRFYRIWSGIKTRCLNRNAIVYLKYGGAGIRICERWINFNNFKSDMFDAYNKHINKYGEKNTSINRITRDKGYSPENCKWSTNKEQTFNRKLKNKRKVHDWEIRAVKELNRKYNIPIKELNKILRIT